MNKVLVLTSGGLDSTVLLYKAIAEVGKSNVYMLNMYYGQKHDIEIEMARWQAKHLDLEDHYIEKDISTVFRGLANASALLKGSAKEIAHESYADQLKDSDVVSAYVPYRNGMLLSIATAIAYSLGCDTVAYGAHAGDATQRESGNDLTASYPDAVAIGSRIYMIDGTTKAIEDIEIGDMVWGFNDCTGLIERSMVVAKYDKGQQPCYKAGPATVSKNHLMWLGKRNHNDMRFVRREHMPVDAEGWYWQFPLIDIDNPEEFKNGYLRGFIEGDGHIHADGTGYITLFQKDATVLEEFLVIAGLSDITIHKHPHKNIHTCYICKEGPQLLERTAFKETRSYLAGYLNGMIIAEGCYTYNNSSHMGALSLEQSVEINPEKVSRIDLCVMALGLKCNAGYRKDGCKYWKFSKAWRIPLRYGAGKLNQMYSKMESHLKMSTLETCSIQGEYVGEKHCYDLTTTSGSFITDGLLVHNCTETFINNQRATIEQGTAGRVTLWAPLWNLDKKGVVMDGIEALMTREEFEHTHSCYEGVAGGCGSCGTCRERIDALDANDHTRGVGQSGKPRKVDS